jgi:predicted AlkP superfamily phosphohydrolase/phosphomutase
MSRCLDSIPRRREPGRKRSVKNRVSVIGLDGATFRLIQPWVNEGNLPVLGKLMRAGVWGELESTIHPLSPQAWASFMTGKNPGKHGIFEFVRHKPNSYDLCYVNGGFVQGKKLWGLLSDVGKRVCVINVPFTYPPDRVNGYLIAGLDAPGTHSGFCHPPELLQELIDRFGDYQLRQHPYKAKPETYLQEIFRQFDYVLKVSTYLKAKEPWDLFMVVFEATDLVQHFYWHYAFPEEFGLEPTKNKDLNESIFKVYERIDEGLGALLDLCDQEESVIVMSDHGFSPCRKIFFMDRWLEQQGYLTYREKAETSYALTRMLHLAFQRYFPNRFKGWVTSLAPELKDRLRSYLTTATIDWRRTRAFSLGIDSTNIFINSKGTFPEGVVEAGSEYEGLRDEVANKLDDLVDPDTGERIVERVYRREELYHGSCVNRAPDLLVTWKGFEYNTRRGYGREGDSLLGSSLDFSDVADYSCLQKSGTHHVKGILVANGNPFRKTMFEGAKIVDLAPTILYLLGQEVPADMDGRVLAEMIESEFISRYPIRVGSQAQADGGPSEELFEYSEQEAKHVRDKLQGLGYIE